MNSKTTIRVVLGMLLTFLATTHFHAQVGIGTTNPASGSMLDIESTDKGILIPRVTLTGTNDVTTVTPAASYGLLVFNTATAGAGTTAVTEGFYYWDGTQWVRIQGEEVNWKIDGNEDIINGTNFLGTLNNRQIEFRTNNTPRFKVPGNQNQVYALADGSRARPFYSWEDDDSMGFWRAGNRQMTLSVDATDFFNVNANGPIREFSINPTSDVMHFRIETDNEPNTLFVNGITDNVGLGTNAPNPSASLELITDNRGLLINRVLLTSRDNAAPITAPATGLLVYNTNTAGTAPNNVSPGFYYWNGSQWIAMDGTGGRDWSLLGNAGTNPSQNFIGTTDATDFVLRTNNSERLRASAAGMLGIATTPYANIRLAVDATSQPYAILGTSTDGIASIIGSDVGSGDGVRGESNTGSGVRGFSDAYHSVYALSPYSGPSGLVAASLGIATGTNLSSGVIGAAINSGSPNGNIGIRAMSGSGQSISPSGYSTIGFNTNAIDLGLYALTQRAISLNTSISTEAAQFKANYEGDALGGDARDPQARLAGYEPGVTIPSGSHSTYYGGYFYSGGSTSNSTYSYVGARRNGTNYKVLGTGTVSTIVDGINPNEKKTMFAAEAPEVLFEDYGTGQLVNGTATIQIDPIFSRNIHVSNEKPLKVFIQLEGDCNGVYVTNKSANGFTVKELQGGTSNVSFSWHIVANRADEVVNGEKTVYQSLRFPDAPLKIEETTELSHSLKEDQKPRKATFEASQK
tara:strand:- start:94797 stop:97034 length:2238 start_codon:yes stop_codon:yes gene_type:complete